jgi:Asp-tRNA(Asn)/Glu-tRNA(Gln) amidotransferase A subunit family amidase
MLPSEDAYRARLRQRWPPKTTPVAQRDRLGEEIAKSLERLMGELRLDAFVYPTWSNPPRGISGDNSATGDNSQLFSPITGWPAIQVPMGYTRGNTLPAGITFFGRAWSEPLLIRLSYSFEQLTRHRKAPPLTPPLR